MNKFEQVDDLHFIFGSLLVAANRMDTLLERELKRFDITSKQWFLCLVIENLFSSPPTLKDIAREMGSSHQNVKQVALKLCEKGLVRLEKDQKDARVTRVVMTSKSKDFWDSIDPKGMEFMKILFEGITAEECSKTRSLLLKMLANMDFMENKVESEMDL